MYFPGKKWIQLSISSDGVILVSECLFNNTSNVTDSAVPDKS